MFFCLAGNEDVIEVHKTTLRAAGDHKMLEDLSSVPQPKRHPGGLVKAERCSDSCLRDVLFSNWYLEVDPHRVRVGEYTAASQIL